MVSYLVSDHKDETECLEGSKLHSLFCSIHTAVVWLLQHRNGSATRSQPDTYWKHELPPANTMLIPACRAATLVSADG